MPYSKECGSVLLPLTVKLFLVVKLIRVIRGFTHAQYAIKSHMLSSVICSFYIYTLNQILTVCVHHVLKELENFNTFLDTAHHTLNIVTIHHFRANYHTPLNKSVR